MAKESELNHDELPFVAPCRKLSAGAPLRWVRRGIGDLMKAPQQSMAYGLAVALTGRLTRRANHRSDRSP